MELQNRFRACVCPSVRASVQARISETTPSTNLKLYTVSLNPSQANYSGDLITEGKSLIHIQLLPRDLRCTADWPSRCRSVKVVNIGDQSGGILVT